MKILHMSDLHYRNTYPKVDGSYKSFLPQMTSPGIFLEMTSAIVVHEQVDLIIISGDLTDDGDVDDYRELKRLFKQYFGHIPHIIGLGNHDNHHVFYEVFEYDKYAKNNETHFNHVVDYQDLRIVIFDNTYNSSPNGSFAPSQLSWLKSTLEASQSSRILLVMHHHLLDLHHQVPAIEISDEFKQMIENSSIIGIICGHTHHAYEGLFMNKPYALAPSLSFRGVAEKETGHVRFEEFPGYQIIEIDGKDISFHNHYLLDQPRLLGKLKL